MKTDVDAFYAPFLARKTRPTTDTFRAEREEAMQWCDLSCEHASFPQTDAVDGAGSCRTFAALFCARLNRLVHKNGPCQCQDQAGSQESQTTGRTP
jgi:hypothetical protein